MLKKYLPHLPEDQITQLNALADLFLEANQKVNLSAIRDRDGVLLKHIVDSLLILPFLNLKAKDRVLDVGTGGGFPGLALAIIFPEVHFCLLDATRKKVDAVQMMADALGLSNVRTLWGRAEELGKDREFRQQFDLVVSRALAKFEENLKLCLPFVRPGGRFFAYQGPELLKSWQLHQALARKLGGHIITCHESILPGEEAVRCFVEVERPFLLA